MRFLATEDQDSSLLSQAPALQAETKKLNAIFDLSPQTTPMATATNRRQIRLLVADDHAVVRQGLVQMLNLESDIQIVGDAFDGQDAVEKAASLQPDVILMDISMPRLNGLEATRLITRKLPAIRGIGLSMHGQGEMTTQMHAAGAKCYLVKDSPIDQIVAAIHRVMDRPAS